MAPFFAIAFVATALAPVANAAVLPTELWHVPEDRAAGEAAGRMDVPEAVAADPSTGHLFVEDRNNARIDEFTAFGRFVKAWGWGVANGATSLQTCGPEATPPTATCRKGIAGSGPGQINFTPGGMGGLAVGSDGGVYVAEMGANHRVQKFGVDGRFKWMIGKDVDQGPVHPGDICKASYIAEGDICGVGTAGTANGEFATSEFGSYLAWQTGALLVGDVGRVQEFDSEGAFKGSITLQGTLSGGTVRALAPASSGNLWLVCSCDGTHVHKVGPSGADLITPIYAERAWSLAEDSAGGVFVSTTNAVPRTEEFEGENQEFVPDSISEVLEFDSSGAPVLGIAEGFAKLFFPGSEGGTAPARAIVSNIVTQAGESDVYTVANSTPYLTAYGTPPDKWPPPLAAPEIAAQYPSAIGATTASVGAEINPQFWSDTTYYVEYGTGRCSEGGCSTLVPLPPGQSLGAGITGTAVAAPPIALSGLAPLTTYHFRIVAQSTGSQGQPVRGVGGKVGVDGGEAAFQTASASLPLQSDCPNLSFRIGAAVQLADCRAYEMVSPIEKNGTDILTLHNLQGNLDLLDQADLSGDKLTFTTSQGFGDALGVPYTSQYIASRTSKGWLTHDITPAQGISGTEPGRRIELEFRAFTDNLCRVFFLRTTDPQLAPGAPEGYFNIYRRQNCGSESLDAVSTGVPPFGTGVLPFEPVLQAISADGRCAVFYRMGPQTLHESCDGQEELVSVRPNGEVASNASAGSGYTQSIGVRTSRTARSVSSDGTRVYWTAGSPSQLYLREHADQPPSAISGETCMEPAKACTLELPNEVGGQEGAASFWSASPDGGTVLYSLKVSGSSTLVKYTVANQKLTTIAAGMLGVVGASADGERVAFVSRNVLGSQPNPEGATPIAGKPNLYLFDGTRTGLKRFLFIGTLDPADAQQLPSRAVSAVAAEPYLQVSRVSSDGNHVAFMSTASLTGYENIDSVSGEKDLEIFLYDASGNAGAGTLACVSCNPNGARPTGRRLVVEGFPSNKSRGAALLPPFSTELFGPRALSDIGNRIFFDSYESLVSDDGNGKADVYEWEAPGSDGGQGKCTVSSPVYSPANGGCLTLISSGHSSSDSEFLDATPSGQDVFFSTAESLVPDDPGLIDIYDARVGGGFPPRPSGAVPCAGEACQGSQQPPPSQSAPATGVARKGNPKPKCPKGTRKVRRHGKSRCVATHRKTKRHKQKAHGAGKHSKKHGQGTAR